MAASVDAEAVIGDNNRNNNTAGRIEYAALICSLQGLVLGQCWGSVGCDCLRGQDSTRDTGLQIEQSISDLSRPDTTTHNTLLGDSFVFYVSRRRWLQFDTVKRNPRTIHTKRGRK